MEDVMKVAPGRPAWVSRVQNQGLTPAVLEQYLAAGWPLEAIAADRNLDTKDVLSAMHRWGFDDTVEAFPKPNPHQGEQQQNRIND